MKCPKCRHENPPESAYCCKCAMRLGPDRPDVTETMELPSEELATGTTFAGRSIREIIEKALPRDIEIQTGLRISDR